MGFPPGPAEPTLSASDLAGRRIGVVGTGTMAEAMVAGLLDRGLIAPGDVICSHPRAARREALASALKVSTTPDNAVVGRGADAVLIAVKPQALASVMPQLAAVLPAEALVISIVAGASSAVLARGLRHKAVVRAMPNTPAQIGAGITVWYGSPELSPKAVATTRILLSALGDELQVQDEALVAMATAISGTGPAYTFMFLEALIDAAVHLGFPRHLARRLVLATVAGSTEFASRSDRHLAELRDMVTSPGGTSASALSELERGGFRTVIADAVWAAYRRTLELAAKLEAGPQN